MTACKRRTALKYIKNNVGPFSARDVAKVSDWTTREASNYLKQFRNEGICKKLPGKIWVYCGGEQ